MNQPGGQGPSPAFSSASELPLKQEALLQQQPAPHQPKLLFAHPLSSLERWPSRPVPSPSGNPANQLGAHSILWALVAGQVPS